MLRGIQRIARSHVQPAILCRSPLRPVIASFLRFSAAPSRTFADRVRTRPQVFGFTGKVAEALFQDAKDEGDMDEISNELRTFQELFDEDSEIQSELTSPLIRGDQYLPILEELYPEMGIKSETAKDLISGLVTTNAAHKLRRILDDFDRLRAFDAGHVKATVTSAQPLSPDQLERLRAALQKQLADGETLDLEERVDESLLGGLKVEMDDRAIDLTVSERLGELDRGIREQ